MIRQLRKRFIIITMISVVAVLGVLMTIINVANYIQKDQENASILAYLCENNGVFPDERKPGGPFDPGDTQNFENIPTPPNAGENRDRFDRGRFSAEAPYDTRYFSVTLWEEGVISDVNTDKIAAISSEEAEALALSLYEQGKNSGYYNSYKYQATATDDGVLYVFLDCRRDLDSVKDFLKTSLLVSLIGVISIFLLVVLLSGRMIRPVEESYRKQKEFITNASHELKTPLAVIESCSDVLAMQEHEDSKKWIDGIREQVKRLSGLIRELITMARMDETEKTVTKTDLSLTELCREAADPFALRSESEGINFEQQIEENITFRGDAEQLLRLLSILLDNALKYTPDGGNILLSLEKKGNRILLQTKNDTEPMVPGKKDEFFDRFYRSDESHSSTVSGYGIGLSMARSIVLSHGGKIEAVSPDGNSLLIKIKF